MLFFNIQKIFLVIAISEKANHFWKE